jgi:hypothetical protein
MKETRISVPELALLAGTRAVLGLGIGLLLAGRLTDGQRKAAGWSLAVVGALTTIPLALEVFGGRISEPEPQSHERLHESRKWATP